MRAQVSQTWAVVVGVSKYSRLPGGQQLQFADRDAAAFADALKSAGVSGDNIKSLIGVEATASALKAVIGNWLARSASESDTVILFFSGHGVLEREFQESYLFGYDSDPKDPYTTALSVNEIGQALKTRVRARRVLILVDALRRDFFDPESAGAGDAATFTKAFNQLSTSRSGASVMMASGPGEFSREGQRWGGHGVFTRHLIDALSLGGDRNADGLITADEVFDYVKTRVAEDTSGKQHPWRGETPLADITVARAERSSAKPFVSARKDVTANRAAEEVARAVPPEKTAAPEPATPKPQPAAPPARETQEPTREAAPAPEPEPTAATPSPTAIAPPNRKTEAPVSKNNEVAGAEPELKGAAPLPSPRPAAIEPRSEVSTLIKPSTPRLPQPSPPAVASVDPPRQTETRPLGEPGELAIANLPPPPRPLVTPPRVDTVVAEPVRSQPAEAPSSVPATSVEAAPSPLVLQIQALIASRNLIDPKNASAWDLFQRLNSDASGAAEAVRLKPLLASALVDAGRGIVGGDVRADNVSGLVDDFKRAGQMFVKARSISSQDAELGVLEKLGAAEALIALQFYDEAERALGQIQNVKLAAIENAFGLVHHGRLDTFRAERAFKRAVELNPKWAAPHYNLALVYRGQQNEQALAELESAAALDSSNSALLVALGDECFARQQWERAAEAFRKAIALRPSDDNLHTKLGHALYSQGLKEEADREYQKARQLRGKQ
ncbi:MAG: caspase family protein [Acidobacteriota bacterium]